LEKDLTAPIMLSLRPESVHTVLCLGAHADDIEIGCGGTLLKLLAAHPGVNVYWVVLSAEGPCKEEAEKAAERILKEAGTRHVVVKDFHNTFFPYLGGEIKEFFRELGQEVSPDLIFTHRGDDAHQDHRLVSELTWNTFRDHLIFEYELPKYDGDLGHPNVYVALDEPTARRKIHALIECYRSRQSKHWFAADTFWSLLCIRGLECRSPTKLAEGLYCRKMIVWGP
jgi:LmbE family N-acetylglucosaminyl deacetylase